MATTNTYHLGLKKAVPGSGEPYSTARNNENLDKIDANAGAVQSAVSAIQTALDGKAAASALTAEESAREAADSALQTDLAKKIPLTVGTAITDPDANNGVYADLFELPVGKYHRAANVTNTQNLPSGMTSAFYCEIVNTISTSRRKIYLYPATSSTMGAFYTCTELSSGYGAWYKFTGEAVAAAASPSGASSPMSLRNEVTEDA